MLLLLEDLEYTQSKMTEDCSFATNRSMAPVGGVLVLPTERKLPAPPPPQLSRTGSASTAEDSDSVSGDSLEGNMVLDVVLPDGRTVKMNVERRMPMMDLLVQATTANKITPGGHIISTTSVDSRFTALSISYKPNTAIGSLNVSTIYIVPKSALVDVVPAKQVRQAQPFEKTFRLQVHLPRQQLLVVRVSQKIQLQDLHTTVCHEKELESSKYILQHPTQPDVPLDYSRTLADYKLTQINLAFKQNGSSSGRPKSSFGSTGEIHTLGLQHKSIFGLMFNKKSKSSLGDSSSDDLSSRGVSPARSDESVSWQRSISPPPVGRTRPTSMLIPSSKPLKKRPAPAPPVSAQRPVLKQAERPPPPPPLHPRLSPSMISDPSHSRHSSDSSGYHENELAMPGDGSSDNVDSEVYYGNPSQSKAVPSKPLSIISQSNSNLVSTSSESTLSLASSGFKKRKAPPPPAKTLSGAETHGNKNSVTVQQPATSGMKIDSELDTSNETRVSESKALVTGVNTTENFETASVNNNAKSSHSPEPGIVQLTSDVSLNKIIESVSELDLSSERINSENSAECKHRTKSLDHDRHELLGMESNANENSETDVNYTSEEHLRKDSVPVVEDKKQIAEVEVHRTTNKTASDNGTCREPAEDNSSCLTPNASSPRSEFLPGTGLSPDDSTTSSDCRTGTDSAIADMEDLDGSSHSLHGSGTPSPDLKTENEFNAGPWIISKNADVKKVPQKQQSSAKRDEQDACKELNGKNQRNTNEAVAHQKDLREISVQTSPVPPDDAQRPTDLQEGSGPQPDRQSDGHEISDASSSTTSDSTINDIDDVFAQVIADAEMAMDAEERSEKDPVVTNASANDAVLPIKHDSVGHQTNQSNHDAEKKTKNNNFEASVEWHNDIPSSVQETNIKWEYKVPALPNINGFKNDDGYQFQELEEGLPKNPPPPPVVPKAKVDEHEGQAKAVGQTAIAHQPKRSYRRTPLENFSISSYKSRATAEDEMYGDYDAETKLVKSESFNVKSFEIQENREPPARSSSFQERIVASDRKSILRNASDRKPIAEEQESSSIEIYNQKSEQSALPNKEYENGNKVVELDEFEGTYDGTGKKVSTLQNQPTEEMLHLQQEYMKLQQQMVQWQQQIITNQTVLERQNLVPALKLQFPNQELLGIPEDDVDNNGNIGETKTSKSRERCDSRTQPVDASEYSNNIETKKPTVVNGNAQREPLSLNKTRPVRPASFSMGAWAKREAAVPSSIANPAVAKPTEPVNGRTNGANSTTKTEFQNKTRSHSDSSFANEDPVEKLMKSRMFNTRFRVEETDAKLPLEKANVFAKSVDRRDAEAFRTDGTQKSEAPAYLDKNVEDPNVQLVKSRINQLFEHDALPESNKISSRNSVSHDTTDVKFDVQKKENERPVQHNKLKVLPNHFLPKPYKVPVGGIRQVSVYQNGSANGHKNAKGALQKEPDSQDAQVKFRRQRVIPSVLPESDNSGKPSIFDNTRSRNDSANGQEVTMERRTEEFDKTKRKTWNVNSDGLPKRTTYTYFGDQVDSKDNAATKGNGQQKGAIKHSNDNVPISFAAAKVPPTQPAFSIQAMRLGNRKSQPEENGKSSAKVGAELQNATGPGKFTTVVQLSNSTNGIPQPPLAPKQPPIPSTGKHISKPKYEPHEDSRDVLMNAIRGFGGRNKLKRVPVDETVWQDHHGGVAEQLI